MNEKEVTIFNLTKKKKKERKLKRKPTPYQSRNFPFEGQNPKAKIG